VAGLSILSSVKKNLGLAEEYTIFDPDITLYINGCFSTLNQLGIGPDDGFAIEDKSATWDDFLGTEKRLNSVLTYVSLRVRLLFDPPTQSFVRDAIEKQISELEWRINVFRENEREPVIVVPPDPDAGDVDPDPVGGWSWDGGGP
jgi:hypothetical protein